VAAGNTYEAIASTTLGSSGSVTFSSIPGTYTDLVVIVNGKATGNGQLSMRLNGGTSLYSTVSITANGSSAGSTSERSATYLQFGYYGYFDATNQAMAIAHIMNYANTTTFKTILATERNTATGVDASVGLWRSTAAITSIETYAAGAVFASGTVVSLYGIKAA
jgi:hypothetical protein